MSPTDRLTELKLCENYSTA